MNQTLDKIIGSKIIAIIRNISSEKIIETVAALKEGGIFCVEVTFNARDEEKSRDTLVSISQIKNHFGDSIAVGAGTVMTSENVKQAAGAGAEYIISPNINESVIKKTKQLGLISIPGALTPSEIINAHQMGADIVKLFPAATLGLEYIKAILSPINHIPITAVGGITSENARSFIDIGCLGVGVGGNLVNKKLVDENKFETIKKLAYTFKLA